jgi:hypothetical protein
MFSFDVVKSNIGLIQAWQVEAWDWKGRDGISRAGMDKAGQGRKTKGRSNPNRGVVPNGTAYTSTVNLLPVKKRLVAVSSNLVMPASGGSRA